MFNWKPSQDLNSKLNIANISHGIKTQKIKMSTCTIYSVIIVPPFIFTSLFCEAP